MIGRLICALRGRHIAWRPALYGNHVVKRCVSFGVTKSPRT